MSSSNAIEDDLCTICKNCKINSIFLECGHMLTCYECGKPMTKCPVCQQDMQDCVNMDKLNEDEFDISEGLKGVPWWNAPMPISKPNRSNQVQKPKEEIKAMSDILSEDLIPKLTNRQLKSLLKGEDKNICEKAELIAEVKARWKNMKENTINEQSSNLDEETKDLCRICAKETIDSMFSDCGHMVTCFSCGQKADQCPICKSKKPQVVSMWELYNEMYSDQQGLTENEEDNFIWQEGVCQSCDKQGIDYIFPECGHMVLCKACVEKNKVCPICQQIKISA